MPDISPSPSQHRRTRYLRLLAALLAGLVTSLALLYLVVASDAFFKTVILPRLANALDLNVTAAHVSFRPLSSLSLRDVSARTPGSEPLFTTQELRVRYKPLRFISGQISLHEFILVNPTIHVTQHPDGSSNLDPFLDSITSSPDRSRPTQSPPQLALRNLLVRDGTLRWTRIHHDGRHDLFVITNLNLSLDQFANGSSGQLTLSNLFRLELARTNGFDTLETRCSTSLSFNLDSNLVPHQLLLTSTHHVERATGLLSPWSDHHLHLHGDLAAGSLKELFLRLRNHNVTLGQLSLSGPLDLSKREANLALSLESIDRQTLNLFGAPYHLDFLDTRLNAIAQVAFLRGASTCSVSGRINAQPLSLSRSNQTVPPLNLHLGFNFTLNPSAKTARLQTFTLTGHQQNRLVLESELSHPVNVSWANGLAASSDTTLTFLVNDLSLTHWRPLLPESLHDGIVNLQLNIIAPPHTRRLTTSLSGDLRNLAFSVASHHYDNLHLAFLLNGYLDNFNLLHLDTCRLHFNPPHPHAPRSNAPPSHSPSGSLSAKGRLNIQNHTGQFDFFATNINQHALAPFIDPWFNLTRLPPVAINGNATASLQPDGRNHLLLQAQMNSLNTTAPIQPSTSDPLNASFQLDSSWHAARHTINQALLVFHPTSLASNELLLTGHLDLASLDPIPGDLQLTADSLDLTPIYDLLTSSIQPSTHSASETTPIDLSSEPDPLDLSLQNLTLTTRINRLYLRELAISNLVAVTRFSGPNVRIEPFQATLNDAPLHGHADFDFSVPGWRYDLALLANAIPIEPIVNTFDPANTGRYRGLFLGNLAIQGSGFTGPNLQQHLSGQLNLSLTNAHIQLVSPKARRLVDPIAAALQLSEITQSPLVWLRAIASVNNGVIHLHDLSLQSTAFTAATRGSIPIANSPARSSLNLPVSLALRRSLADKARLLPSNDSTNAAYVPLPDFVSITGSLENPRTELNQLAISGLLLKSGVGVANRLGVNVDSTTSHVLRTLGDLLTGQQPANPPPTNSPAPPPP
jgi:hypothetical protein